MSLITNIQNVGLLVGVFSLLLFFLYRLALPRPIPGIPYNKLAASRILGDLAEALPFKDETGSLFSYFPDLAERLDTPIFQAFMRPFGKPWIILMDPYVTRNQEAMHAHLSQRPRLFMHTMLHAHA